MRCRGGFGTGRKDYTLLRVGTAPETDDVEATAGKTKGAGVFRLIGLAKEEALVRFASMHGLTGIALIES